MFQNLSDVTTSVTSVTDGNQITNPEKLRSSVIDELVYTSVFSENEDVRRETRSAIRSLAKQAGVISSSIYGLYQAIGEGKAKSTFTVPAFNIRALTYDSACIIFQLAKEHEASAFVFEIARSEIDYTMQEPDEYATSVLAAAIKEGYVGPVFLQGDHYQFSARKFKENKDEEIEKIKQLIKKSIAADFLNIDIDASTLVDLEKENLSEQQQNNSEMTAILTKYIREIQPQGKT
ncbi:MAG: class II fructose-bisphosphate aldolase, partial [Candidatus Levyibacteriota bacterium]